MEETKNNMKIEKLNKFDKLISEFVEENELSQQSKDLIKSCKIGFRKLRIAKEFSNIDEELLKVSSSGTLSTDFFSNILFLESKRLAFKEEALKCHNQQVQIQL